jgi:hypothetical protein
MDFVKSSSPIPVPDTVVKAIHPFYPLGVEIVNFAANDKTLLEILGGFAAGSAVILGATWMGASRLAPNLRQSDKWTILWFCLSMKPDERAQIGRLTSNRRNHSFLLRRLFCL